MFAILEFLNNNRILWGVTMLLLNMGSRYVAADLGKFHEAILSNEYFKKIILFSMFFVATRDIATAFLLSILYVLVVDGILHEKRKFCIVPSKYKQPTTNTITNAQYAEAKNIIDQYQKQSQAQPSQAIQASQPNKESYQNAYMAYTNSLKILNTR